MKSELYFVGKTTDKYLIEGIELYLKRLKHYLPVEVTIIPPSPQNEAIKGVLEEGAQMLARIKLRDFVVLMDENGSMLSSIELSSKMQKWMLEGYNKLIFITGGAYGLSEPLRKRANYTLSASKFTFTHQMIRLILVEQLYRAMTIIKNESYHHG